MGTIATHTSNIKTLLSILSQLAIYIPGEPIKVKPISQRIKSYPIPAWGARIGQNAKRVFFYGIS